MIILKHITEPWGAKIELFESVESTNDTIRNGSYSHADVVVAEYQSKGRGQKGNQWSSQKGLNLMFSLLLHPIQLSATKQFQLSKAVSLAIVDTLSTYGVEAKIKWPNDIYVGENKITGTLIETSISGENISSAVVGIGVNVNQRDFPDSLPNPTSLSIEAGHNVEPIDLLSRLYVSIMERCHTIAPNDEATDKEYLDKLYYMGTERIFEDASGSFMGTICGVDNFGRLVVRHSADGTTKSYGLKEISTRPCGTIRDK